MEEIMEQDLEKQIKDYKKKVKERHDKEIEINELEKEI